MTGVRLDIASISEVGERKRNEDCVDIIRSEAGTCVVLCDGLGGHEAGDLASACVCGSIRRRFEACTQEDKLEDLAYGLVLQAQDDLLQYQQELGKTGGMKTTACCLVIRDGKAAAAYVGDSRIYLIRKKKILCRSKDHSIPQYLVNIGEIKDGSWDRSGKLPGTKNGPCRSWRKTTLFCCAATDFGSGSKTRRWRRR